MVIDLADSGDDDFEGQSKRSELEQHRWPSPKPTSRVAGKKRRHSGDGLMVADDAALEFSDIETPAPRPFAKRAHVPTPARAQNGLPRSSVAKSNREFQSDKCEAKTENNVEPAKSTSSYPEEGYTLHDLRRVVSAMLPRYRHLLSGEEYAALVGFSNLSLRAQQLYARLFGRKWPQWVRLDGLGERYKELGDVETRSAVSELAATPLSEPLDLTGPTQPPVPSQVHADMLVLPDPSTQASGPVAAWLLDSSCESATSLLARPLQRPSACAAETTPNEYSYGTLLLEAQPMADLRQLARSLGVSDVTKGRRGVKEQLLSKVCSAARRQRVLNHPGDKCHTGRSTEVRLVEQALHAGHWICLAPTPGRTVLALLTDLFHVESCGAPDSSFLVFSSHWPSYSFEASSTLPLFDNRAALDLFLLARRFTMRVEQSQERPSVEQASIDANFAEAQLRSALEVADASPFEAAKFNHPFRRRFTAAWCWAGALHSAVMHSPAVKDSISRETKIRHLRLLLDCGLCISRRGQWYNELIKEVARSEGNLLAMQLAAESIAEGEPKPVAARITVDLVSEPSSQEEESCAAKGLDFPCLPQDARWELAKRCRTLAQHAGGNKKGGKKSWQYWLRNTPAAQAKAADSDDGGRWLPTLVSRLLAEEAAAPGNIRQISCSSVGLPSANGQKGRRLFDSYGLAELSVEELAMEYYFQEAGFDCGMHCEGAFFRDLFGIVLYSELFDSSVEGVFLSAYQDAPLDLGTEAFYPTRKIAIEKRLAGMADLSPEELSEEINTQFAQYHGTRVCGVRWDRYEGSNAILLRSTVSQKCAGEKPDEGALADEGSRRGLRTRSDDVPEKAQSLGAVAGAVGGRALAAALRLLCMDYKSSGLPDLLLWSSSSSQPPRARFVEVKSENDSLSRRQRLWLATLREAGADAEVCHVRDVAEAASE